MGKADADGPELPDLPPEWGRVVVPDDAAALAAEAAQVRRELRGAARGRTRRPALAYPALVIVVALLTTIGGLLVATWPRTGRSTGLTTTTPDPTPAGLAGRPLPALDLVDAGQAPVPLRGLLPAVVLLVDGCPCPDRVVEAAAAAPPGVTVVTVSGGRTPTGPPPPGVRALADPAGGLRAFVNLPARPDSATVLLVDRGGLLVRVVPAASTVEEYRADLTRLAPAATPTG
ncbi:hypothetical protein GA0070616_2133 [Micromonospora nigra]|uniref:Thioredoxin domain-containing protein n=1 Tax=Micromonospora nigra TaxID=145857 RepID=A0A1C6RUL0_9ACTN|nr:hypothetical protein [Micromonospora nigra]SCL20896.1 hypothetical protein GA0070616_2133 [Micromonospora nigra]